MMPYIRSAMVLLVIPIFLLTLASVRADRKIDLSAEIGPETVPEEDFPDESSISIVTLPDSIDTLISAGGFADLPFKISVYKGDTLKRTVYTKIVDSRNWKLSPVKKFKISDKFVSRNFSDSLELKSSCSFKPPFFFSVSGLGLEERRKIDIPCPEEDYDEDPANDSVLEESEETLDEGSASSASHKRFSFKILDFPKTISSGTPFNVRVKFFNPTPEFMDVDAWSYVYRYSVCYSGDREQNRKIVNVPDFSNVTFDLSLEVDASPGDYKLKLKVVLPGRKTPKELTEDIRVLASSPDDTTDTKEASQGLKITSGAKDGSDNTKDSAPKKIISSEKVLSMNSSVNVSDSSGSGIAFLSSSAKARRLVPFLLIIALSLLLIALVMRNF